METRVNPNRPHLIISGELREVEPRDVFVERYNEVGFVKYNEKWILWLHQGELEQLDKYDRVSLPDLRKFKCFRIKLKTRC